MLLDAIPFASGHEKNVDIRIRAIGSFVSFLERKLGVSVVRDARTIPFGRAELLEPFALGNLLLEKGIITSFFPITEMPDEPALKYWGAVCNDSVEHGTGGSSWTSEPNALYAALAEALERYLWTEARDYFVAPREATESEIAKRGAYIPIAKFAGFSPSQRSTTPALQLDPQAKYLWVRAHSFVTGQPTYLPAQTSCGLRSVRNHGAVREPLIRVPITTGLATWPTPEIARLSGALEVIERDAYMIMWLNQLTLPRISLEDVCSQSKSLSAFVSQCHRYRLKPHIVRLITDAPAYAICVVLEDESGHAPRFTVGLKAHRSLSYCIEEAMLEALRARRAYRNHFASGNIWNEKTPAKDIGHRERLYYWGVPENAERLAFLIRGKEEKTSRESWDTDTPEAHFARIVQWCRSVGYECASLSLGTSRLNPTPWSIEMVVIPELQPTHLSEDLQHLGGARLIDIPRKFGYTPRERPFSEEPHPFS